MSAEDIMDRIPSTAAPEIAAQSAILSSLMPLSFVFRSELAEEITMHGILSAEQGFTEYAPLAYSALVLFKLGLSLYKEANVIRDVTRALLNRVKSP